MAPGPLGQGRADHIDAVIKRPLQVCGREGIVDDEGQAVVVGQVVGGVLGGFVFEQEEH